jgi:hypothetical protein
MHDAESPARLDAGPLSEPPVIDARRPLPSGDVARAVVFAVLALLLVLHGDDIPALVTALAAGLFVIEAFVHRRRDDQLGRAFGRAVGRALASRRRFRA